MAIDANLIQQNLNTALQQVRPADNLLTGFQTGQGLVQNQQNLLRGDLQNQALQAQVQQQAELAKMAPAPAPGTNPRASAFPRAPWM